MDHARGFTRRVGKPAYLGVVLEDAEDNRISVRAESDAMIVSGLIAILIRLYSGATRADISQFDADAFLTKIGVKGALSAQRSNGLASMLERIQTNAAAPT